MRKRGVFRPGLWRTRRDACFEPSGKRSSTVACHLPPALVASQLIMLHRLLPFALVSGALLAADLPSDLFDRLEWRNIGPASMGGRVTAVRGIPGDPALVYVATASGGLFKTVNGGTTWTPIFDYQDPPSPSATSPLTRIIPMLSGSAPGEANARNSVSFGDGVYLYPRRRKDLAQHGASSATHHISRVVREPPNSNIVLRRRARPQHRPQ